MLTWKPSTWSNSLAIPVYCAVLSVVLHAISVLRDARVKRKPDDDSDSILEPASLATSPSPRVSWFRRRVNSVGGIVIVLFRLVQLLSVLALLALSVLSLLSTTEEIGRVQDALPVLGLSQCFLYVCDRHRLQEIGAKVCMYRRTSSS